MLGYAKHVLLYSPKPLVSWLKMNKFELKPVSGAKFYVAITRAKYSVGIVWNDGNILNSIFLDYISYWDGH